MYVIVTNPHVSGMAGMQQPQYSMMQQHQHPNMHLVMQSNMTNPASAHPIKPFPGPGPLQTAPQQPKAVKSSPGVRNGSGSQPNSPATNSLSPLMKTSPSIKTSASPSNLVGSPTQSAKMQPQLSVSEMSSAATPPPPSASCHPPSHQMSHHLPHHQMHSSDSRTMMAMRGGAAPHMTHPGVGGPPPGHMMGPGGMMGQAPPPMYMMPNRPPAPPQNRSTGQKTGKNNVSVICPICNKVRLVIYHNYTLDYWHDLLIQ